MGSAFRTGRGHATDDRADGGGALPTVQPQPLQERDQLHLLQGPQGDLFDADAAWPQQLQGSDIDALEQALGTGAGGFGSARAERYLAGEQLRGDALRFALDRGRNRGRDQGLLAAEKLFEADTQQRPISLWDVEVATKIEQRALPDASGDAFGVNEAKGEVVVADADALVRHQQHIEGHLFDQVTELFGLQTTVTLYDLTNTYFEGVAAAQPLASHGHSKEQRSDCPLLTLALVLDGSGYVRRSEVMAGKIVEGKVLRGVLERLEVPKGALIVMDCGAATEDNLKWLRDQGYRYLVVSLERTRRFDESAAVSLTTAGQQQVKVQQVHSDDGAEVRLYCYSPARQGKEQAMLKKARARFE